MLEKVKKGKRFVVHHRLTQAAAAVTMLVAVFMAFAWAPPIYAPMDSTFEVGENYFASGKERFTADGSTHTGPASMEIISIEETDSAYHVEGQLTDGNEATIDVSKSDVKRADVERSDGELTKLTLSRRVHQGEVWRIFYFHVGISWVMALAFFHTFVASLLYLRKERPRWDLVAGASAEVGFILATLVLVTGSIWAKPAWGTWWDWDPRLTTSLVLWLIYAGYLSLRGEGQERSSAVYGVLAFATVPITFVSIRLWKSVHPAPVEAGAGGVSVNIDAPILLTMMVALVAMTLLYIHVMSLRVKLGIAENRLKEVKGGRK